MLLSTPTVDGEFASAAVLGVYWADIVKAVVSTGAVLSDKVMVDDACVVMSPVTGGAVLPGPFVFTCITADTDSV